MNIVVGSAFRNSNSAGRLGRYFGQVQRLQVHAGADHSVRVIAAEGDSTDGTRDALTRTARTYGLPLTLAPCDHGGPVYGSTEGAERLAALSGVGNAILDHVTEEDDVLVYVESDLLWDAHTIGTLIDIATERREGVDVAAPMVMAGDLFYDIWAFRIDGRRFSPFPPFHEGLAPRGMTVVDSAGSCLVMRRDVARGVRIINGNGLVGWCENARAHGYRIAVHRDFRVQHP